MWVLGYIVALFYLKGYAFKCLIDIANKVAVSHQERKNVSLETVHLFVSSLSYTKWLTKLLLFYYVLNVG